MEKKLTNSGPLREPADKHSIYAHLHAFDTANAALVEGLIWTAIAAAVLKRFLAPMT